MDYVLTVNGFVSMNSDDVGTLYWHPDANMWLLHRPPGTEHLPLKDI